MLWLLVLVMLSDNGQLRLIVKPVESQAKCEAAVNFIRAARPSALAMHECISVEKMAGLGT